MTMYAAISLEVKLHPKIIFYDWFLDIFYQNIPIQQESDKTVGGNVWFAANTRSEPKHDMNAKTVTLDYVLNPALNYITHRNIIKDCLYYLRLFKIIKN